MGIKQLLPHNWKVGKELFSSYPKAREVMPVREVGAKSVEDSITWRKGKELGGPLIIKLAESPHKKGH